MRAILYILRVFLSPALGWLCGIFRRKRELQHERQVGRVEGAAEAAGKAYADTCAHVIDDPHTRTVAEVNRAKAERKRMP